MKEITGREALPLSKTVSRVLFWKFGCLTFHSKWDFAVVIQSVVMVKMGLDYLCGPYVVTKVDDTARLKKNQGGRGSNGAEV